MPSILPEQITTKAIPLALKRRNYFPSIFRIFPEKSLISLKIARRLALSIVLVASVVLFILTANQYRLLGQNRQTLKELTLQRQNLEKEVSYWQNIAGNYKNYPDIYLKIASLEYRLGQTQNAKNYIDKALTINPELEQGKVLGASISK